jgi:hypothetical protein
MAPRNKTLATLATAALLTGALGAPPMAASATRLTRAAAEAAARRDAAAATVLYGGDKVKATCRATGRNVFRCQILLTPVHSGSRCRWTDTVRLVRGRPQVGSYSHASCSD